MHYDVKNLKFMRVFLKRISVFILLLIITVGTLACITGLYAKYTFDFTLNQSNNILVLGNSHPECAINDSIVPRTKNLAQSGAAYFYDYLKLKTIVQHNKQIDTVVIGYTYDILQKDMDSWFANEQKINTQIRYYFFLFNFDDYLSLVSANPVATLKSTPQTIFHNIRMKSKGFSYLGGYKALHERKLAKAKELLQPIDIKKINEYSKYQIKYLLKIYEFCESQNISLILLNTPIHHLLEEAHNPLKKGYYDFAEKNLPNATIMNNANFQLPDSAYRDLSHLNSSGATIYSNELKRQLNRFK